MAIKKHLQHMPLIGIFRGIQPNEAIEVIGAAIDAGLTMVEVPLNSPEPFESIKLLSQHYDEDILIGAGTVTDVASVKAVYDAGGKLIVTPFAREAVVEKAKSLGMQVVSGALTPTEIADMFTAGADAVKIFPAEMTPPKVLKAIRAVISHDYPILPVGGIDATTIADYWSAGASGFGLGSSIYQVGDSAAVVSKKAKTIIAATTDMMKSF